MTFDAKKFKQLLDAKKIDEAKSLLSNYLKTEVAPEERASALITFAQVFASVTRENNESHLAELEAAKKALDSIDALERAIDDKAQLIAVKQKISDI